MGILDAVLDDVLSSEQGAVLFSLVRREDVAIGDVFVLDDKAHAFVEPDAADNSLRLQAALESWRLRRRRTSGRRSHGKLRATGGMVGVLGVGGCWRLFRLFSVFLRSRRGL